MKVVIMAGGKGLRMREETVRRPKPMVTVGGKPLLWHIIRHFIHYDFREFIIAAGYRGSLIEEFAATVEFDCRIDVVDTGRDTATGGRLGKLGPRLKGGAFMMTWGDAVADIDLRELAAFHRRHGLHATVTAVHPPPRFGRLILQGNRVARFSEKQPDPDEWINGAYFVLEPEVLELIDGDATQWEDKPMSTLVARQQLAAYRHGGFWQCMDTLHERELLETVWRSGDAPWRVWA